MSNSIRHSLGHIKFNNYTDLRKIVILIRLKMFLYIKPKGDLILHHLKWLFILSLCTYRKFHCEVFSNFHFMWKLFKFYWFENFESKYLTSLKLWIVTQLLTLNLSFWGRNPWMLGKHAVLGKHEVVPEVVVGDHWSTLVNKRKIIFIAFSFYLLQGRDLFITHLQLAHS